MTKKPELVFYNKIFMINFVSVNIIHMEEEQKHEVAQPKKARRSRRNKEEIERDLFSAITIIIQKQGFGKPMINHVSEEANVIKRVIYENYDSFDDLLKLYFSKNDFWTFFILDNIANQSSNYKEFFTNVLKAFFTTFDENQAFQSIVRWEVASPDKFVQKRARERERNCNEELQGNVQFFQSFGIDIEALYALLIGGIYYLILRKDVSTICNIDVSTKAGKKRILATIDKLAELIFYAQEQKEEKKRIAQRLFKRGISIEEIAQILEIDQELVSSFVHDGE